MRLAIPQFELGARVGLQSIERFGELAGKLDRLGESSGKGSLVFQARCDELLALKGTSAVFQKFVVTRRDVRVVLHLWKVDLEWFAWRPPTEERVVHLIRISGQLKSANLVALADTFFLNFDLMTDFAAIGNVIATQYQLLPRDRLMAAQKLICLNREIVFAENAPEKIASAAVGAKCTLAQCLAGLGMENCQRGRYVEACKNAYYVKIVESLEVGENHAVFDEIRAMETRVGPFDARLNVGQKVSQLLIQKCARLPKGLPTRWMQFVLDVLGDPRRPKSSPAYQKWWSAMAAADERLMRQWLAGADLRLFLKILKDSSTDEALQRMYPARRRFLEGLLEHQKIVDARLFLGAKAADLIKREFGTEALAAHGRLSEQDKTVIYMNIDDKLHFFEGTHNYKARGGGILPTDHRILSRAKVHFDYFEFTTRLEHELAKAGNTADPPLEPFSRVHHPPVTWQNTLIWEFEYYDVNVDPETVLTRDDYREYRQKFGL